MKTTTNSIPFCLVRPLPRRDKVKTSFGELQLNWHSHSNIEERRPQEGVIIHAPRRWDTEGLSEGDLVILDYKVVSDNTPNDPYRITFEDSIYNSVYRVPTALIYGKAAGESVQATGKNVLGLPVMETEADIRTASGLYVKSAPGVDLRKVKVVSLGNWQHVEGKYAGYDNISDILLTDQQGDIPIESNGKEYCQYDFENILAYLDGDEIRPLSNWMWVKVDPSEFRSKSGIIYQKPQRMAVSGEIIYAGPGGKERSELRSGDKVIFPYTGGKTVSWNGEEFRVIREGDIQCKSQ